MNTQLVGIVNVTPDSFSDGDTSDFVERSIVRVEQLITDGADVIDIGAESTRPGAQAVPLDEEWRRLQPVLKEAVRLCGIENRIVSVDTRHAVTMRRALDIGANWINDVGGFSNNEAIEIVRGYDCKLVVMHSLSVPASKDVVLPADSDVMDVLLSWGKERIERLREQGISDNRIIIDPGIGFGKTAEQSLDILSSVSKLHSLGVSLLVGHSRKSFMNAFTNASAGERDELTLATSLYLRQQGVYFLRVHNVTIHKESFELWNRICSNR